MEILIFQITILKEKKKTLIFFIFTFTGSLYVLAFCLKCNVLCLLHIPNLEWLARQVVFRLPHFTIFTLRRKHKSNPFLMHVWMDSKKESRTLEYWRDVVAGEKLDIVLVDERSLSTKSVEICSTTIKLYIWTWKKIYRHDSCRMKN